MTTLIVEDEPAMLRALTETLTRAGFTVLEAHNGQEGLAVALREHPDLILLDLIMPVMDGMTMLRQLREDAWGKTAPVIILTNLSDAAKASEALQHHAFDFLVKSDWKLEDVVRKVRERLGDV